LTLSENKLKIFVTGTRGIPNIPGGVEKHCQELYPLIARLGHDVHVATRKHYVIKKQRNWKNVKLVHVYAPRKKNLEAIIHTFLAVIEAWKLKADIIHIHAVGPGLMVPFAKMIGLKVVVTNHGPDYDRQKWGRTAKLILKLGEYFGGKFSDEVIVISTVIQKNIFNRCKRQSQIIYNGVPLPEISEHIDFLIKIGVKPKDYIIAVSRFVPEKGLELLINAFLSSNLSCKLVIAGDADHATKYSKNLKKTIDDNDNIIKTGYITGEPLNQLFSHAGLFVLPSFHEGLPIALLEALSYQLPVLVSDIPANLEVGLDKEKYFKCGEINELKLKLSSLFIKGIDETEKKEYRKMINKKYNWQSIAEQTVAVYKKIYPLDKAKNGIL